MRPTSRIFSYRFLFWVVALATTVLRLLVIGRIGLGDDEAHYWAFAANPDWSYFDHPPAIGYLIKASTFVFGANEFAVRLPAVLLFLLTTWLVFLLARRMFDEKTAFWSVVLLSVTPVFSFLGAVLTVPDAPLAFFWMLFIYVFWRLLETGRPGWWYVLGGVMGLGLLSKYNAVLLAPSALLFLLLAPRYRFWLARKEPWLACAAAFAVFLPVVIWNLENHWVSFGYQLGHGFGHKTPEFSFELLGRALGAQAGYLSPILFFLYWGALFGLARRFWKERDDRALFLFSFSFPTLFLFNGVASFNEILPHWPAMGYLVLAVAVAHAAVVRWQGRFFKGVTFAAWGFGALLTVLVPLQAVYKVLEPAWFLPADEAARIEDGVTKAEKVDVTNELYGWPAAGRRIAALIEGSPDPKPFIFTNRHYIASQLSFYVPGHPRIYCLSERIDAYDFWHRDLSSLDGRAGIFVSDNRFYAKPEELYPFASWQAAETVEAFRAGRKVRVFFLTRGAGFRLSDLKPEYTAGPFARRLTWQEGLRRLDHRVFRFINREQGIPLLDYLMITLTTIGNGLPLALVVGVVLWTTRRERFWREFLLALLIVSIGGLFVQLIKNVVARVRPCTVFGDEVRVLGETLYRCSFPSGHTQASFAAATFLSTRFRTCAWLFFMLAFLVGLSRVYVGAHFPLDVLAGAVTGIAVSLLLLKLPFAAERKPSRDASVSR